VTYERPASSLAEPRLDFRVDRASAASYEVKAGEFIQIIDVQGKQCSDFLAFHRDKLEDGLERGLDATVTRTLMGNAYPQPGLYGKFYDQDFDPLCEVVRDTVGRHDTFALACQAKYYENLGYPGHVNCTDNFNGALEPFPIAARRGWPALNFFYNTGFDSDNMLIMDEPSEGLAPIIIQGVWEAIGKLKKEGLSILLVEQNARTGLSLAHNGVVLESGRVRLEGSHTDILNNPEIGHLYLGGTLSNA